jgi:hypothetical protein
MKKYHIIPMLLLSAIFFLVSHVSACMKAYGETAAAALQAGFQLAERHDAISAGKVFPSVRVRILSEKENGFFVAEVHSSAFCFINTKEEDGMSDIMPEAPDCKPRKKFRAAGLAVRRGSGI